MEEYAARNDSAFLTHRLNEEERDPKGTVRRDPYQRDRHRIMHSRAFRRTIHKIIRSEEISISDSKSEYLIRQMFKAFYQHPLELPDYVLSRYFRLANRTEPFSRDWFTDKRIEDIQKDKLFIRLIADHIGGMTDQYASRTYKQLYYPDYI